MTFKELKKNIEQYQDKETIMLPISISTKDEIQIISSLYDCCIPCNDIKSVNDIYDVIKAYKLDPELFEKPYYLRVLLNSLDEETINIINQLDDNVFVEIMISNNFDIEKMNRLLKLSHVNLQFVCYGWMDIDMLQELVRKFTFSEDSSPVVIINRIDSNTSEKIVELCKRIKNIRFRVEIKDAESLQNLDSIIPYIPEDEILIVVDDNLFNEKYPKNARELIVQNTSVQKPSNKKLNIQFRDIKYDSFEQLYDLEKNIELIKSHIPSDASELDIITYVTLFMINYFKYDYDMYEKSKANQDTEDINLTQFISRGEGVCRHFAGFTKYILDSLGIECEKLDSSDDSLMDNDFEGHSFNLVTIEGKQYFIDNTWIVERMQRGMIHSLAESSDFLTSNETFGHDDYKDIISQFQCENYDRQEINDSTNRVIEWNSNYVIHAQSLRDLFKKYALKMKKSVAERIEDAIPRRK